MYAYTKPIILLPFPVWRYIRLRTQWRRLARPQEAWRKASTRWCPSSSETEGSSRAREPVRRTGETLYTMIQCMFIYTIHCLILFIVTFWNRVHCSVCDFDLMAKRDKLTILIRVSYEMQFFKLMGNCIYDPVWNYKHNELLAIN